MNEMVERVATAIVACEKWSSFWDIEDAKKLARAAIVAMRARPPDAVLRAGWDSRSVKDNALDAVNDIWQTMIDAALTGVSGAVSGAGRNDGRRK